MGASILAALLVLAGCGKDSASNAPATSVNRVTPVSVPVATITARDTGPQSFTYDMPTQLPGGVVTLRLKNTGKVAHDFQLVRQVPGHTLNEVISLASDSNAKLATWFSPAGGVGAVAAGQAGEVTLNLAPGKYWYFCTQSSGGQGGGPQVAHVSHGMAGELTVSGQSGAPMPKPTATVTATEYKFLTQGLKSGTNLVRFVNVGKQVHHLQMFAILNGKSLADAKAALLSNSPPPGPPAINPDQAIGSAVVGAHGELLMPMDLKPGKYLLACFMPDLGTTGPPHFLKGMLQELDVT